MPEESNIPRLRAWLLWVVACVVGSGLGIGLAWSVGSLVFEIEPRQQGGMRMLFGPLDAALFYALAGVVLGITQWLVLRPHVSSAGWWVLAVTVASVLFGEFSVLVDGVTSSPAAFVPGAMMLGLVGGAITRGPLGLVASPAGSADASGMTRLCRRAVPHL